MPEGRGRGIALGIKSGPTTGLSNSLVRLLTDGSVVVYCGTQDMGQGARTIFAQIRGGSRGARASVSVVMGDTAVVPYDQQTSASRSTVMMGKAVPRAGVPELVAMAGARARMHQGRRQRSSASAKRTRMPDARPSAWWVGAFFEFNATAVEVSVDEQTGDITVHRHATVSDVGRSINRLQVHDAGRRRRDHGPRPHVDGALHVRLGRADPKPRRDRLPHPDVDGPAARDAQRYDRER